MSRWDWDERHPRAPKKPPPAHGIRMKKAGTTWWGQRWIAALEQVLGGDAGRLSRGKTYARAGRAHDLDVKAGTVTAQVTGTRSAPYEVAIRLAQLSDEIWLRAIERMGGEAQFAAELLGGQMPARIDEVFVALGASLFPQSRADLETSCSCPDWGDPCKHVAATHYLLGEAFDADPFLLFELRGRARSSVLAGLRQARGVAAAPEGVPTSGPDAASEALAIPRVRLGALAAADYDRARAPLPKLVLSFDAPDVHGALLRQLGVPGAWRGEATPEELLAPLVARAAEAARRIALAENEESPAPQTPAGDAPAAAAQARTAAPRRRQRSPRASAAKAGSAKEPRSDKARPAKRRR
jgi:uncharacterized Zn finger protein